MARTKWATHIYDTSQKSIRIPAGKVDYIVIHHAAATSFQAVIDMEMGRKQVSSTCVIKDDKIASMFDEAFRAWSLSSTYWDSVSLSVETCNSGGDPDWPISDASYRSLARVVSDWCQRYGIPCNRDRVIGHNEVYSRFGASYGTFCPGDQRGKGIDLNRVVREANAILQNSSSASADGAPVRPADRSQQVETVKRPNGAIYNVADQFIKHLLGGQASTSAAVQYDNDSPHALTEAQFWDIIDAYAIPRSQVYGQPGVPAGHVWSAEHDIKASQARIELKLDALLGKPV